MSSTCRIQRRVALAALAALASSELGTQNANHNAASKDSVTVQASNRYGASDFHRYMLGDNYRDIWGTPIRVPLLDLKRYAGGLTPTETGGGRQTRSLRLAAANGIVYTFRPVYKARLEALSEFENTIVIDIFRDGLSALHPVAPVVAAPFLQAAGVLHPHPVLVVMPNDASLGEFREEFAGLLGTLEEHVSDKKPGDEERAFHGAAEVIDSDELLRRLNKDPATRLDARALLAARLMDLFLNDKDRHRDQWKWARFSDDPNGPWVAVPRDRDQALINHEGVLLSLARLVKPSLTTFDASYGSIAKIWWKVLEFDQRLLQGLDKRVWDSVATALQHAVSDSVIAAAIHAAPRAYWPRSAGIAAKLRARRDGLPNAAAQLYSLLAAMPELHGSDAADSVSVVRSDGAVTVTMRSQGEQPWFQRRFVPAETREIRLYLHGGDDHAEISGTVPGSIIVRIIGGNGTNTFADNSAVGGRRNTTRVHDMGTVAGVEYGKDSLFNRLPWLAAYGGKVPPQKDRGARIVPRAGFGTGHGLGLVTEVGYRRYRYGFRYVPYASMNGADLEYATEVNGLRAAVTGDRRFRSSQWHITADAAMSQLEMVEFRGFGNDVSESRDPFFDLRQRQWTLRIAAGFALGEDSDVSLGPIVKYVVTDSVPNNFVSEEVPLGFPRFGQAGLQLLLEHDTRDDGAHPTRGFDLQGSIATYPAVWDVSKAFTEVSGVASTYLEIPLFGRHPVLALRAGGKRVFGDFPYYEAAFVGGRRSVRTFQHQRFAGDASIYGTTELRLPLARMNYILPWDFGLVGFMDAGRVYVDNESPGGWHSVSGGGVWIGMVRPGYGITILATNRAERRLLVGTGFAF